MKTVALVVLAGIISINAYTYREIFETDPLKSNRWVPSNWKQDSGEAGSFEYSGGLWPASDSRKGIRTTQDAKFYAISSKLPETFDNTDKTLVFQFSVKHEQKIGCGGGYVKLLPPNIDQSTFNGETPYTIMFGPDICGYSTKKVHTIFNFNGENLLKKDDVKSPDDEFTHFYTLIVNPDDTYDIWVDGESKDSGNLKDGWDFEKPKKIKDPEAKKPKDWIDDEYMDDPEDSKPEDWDDEPEKIPDPDATKPEDWDDEEDGEWEAPMISNPEYKGEWKPKRIKNPEYKGQWIHPEIDNPDYVEHTGVYKRGPIGFVGIEVWQVQAGTVFSDFLLTDSVDEAKKEYEAREVSKDAEEKAKKAYDDINTPEEPEEEEEEEEEVKSEL